MNEEYANSSINKNKAVCPSDEPLLLAKRLFENLILTLISKENARDSLHFKYVSPEWIGNPGWYFWPKTKPGVYFLRLETASLYKSELDASFQLYYYPHPQEEVFTWYSFDEQLTRISAFFSDAKPENACVCLCQHDHSDRDFSDLRDGVGVPIPEIRGKLNSWLYLAGRIDFLWERGEIKRCTVEAPNRSCTWACKEIIATDENGNTHTLLDQYEIDRNVPAWEICIYFASNLLNDLSLLNIAYSLKEEQLDQNVYSFQNRVFSLRYTGENNTVIIG